MLGYNLKSSSLKDVKYFAHQLISYQSFIVVRITQINWLPWTLTMNMIKLWRYGMVISFSPVVCHNLEISASCSKSRGGSRRARLAVTRFSNFIYPKTDFCQSTTSQSAPLGHYLVFACPSLASVAYFSRLLQCCSFSLCAQ